MIKFSKIIKDIGFSFSFKRLKKALLLITLFTLIGLSIYFLNKYEDSEIGLKKLYEKEISGKIDIEDNSIIRIYKKEQICHYGCKFILINWHCYYGSVWF